ncbi:Succinate dehydrogenase cytochrome b560 subunit, mitochondrial, partial [Stegodyphus mimosarum]
MALYLTCYRYLGRQNIKQILSSMSAFNSTLPFNTSAVIQTGETFFEKNERLKRPLSPHLSIYKLQLTSILSVTHRFTGLVLSGGLYGLSIGMLVLPSRFPYYIDYLQSLHISSALIFSLKFALAWTVFYHTANGVRHLAWDMGYGYDLKNLYLSGYLVLGTSLVASAIAAAM